MDDMKCWGKSPTRGVCPEMATRFFVSLVTASIGTTPRNRAVCDACAAAFRFDHFVKHGVIREVPRHEWEVSPWGVEGRA